MSKTKRKRHPGDRYVGTAPRLEAAFISGIHREAFRAAACPVRGKSAKLDASIKYHARHEGGGGGGRIFRKLKNGRHRACPATRAPGRFSSPITVIGNSFPAHRESKCRKGRRLKKGHGFPVYMCVCVCLRFRAPQESRALTRLGVAEFNGNNGLVEVPSKPTEARPPYLVDETNVKTKQQVSAMNDNAKSRAAR